MTRQIGSQVRSCRRPLLISLHPDHIIYRLTNWLIRMMKNVPSKTPGKRPPPSYRAEWSYAEFTKSERPKPARDTRESTHRSAPPVHRDQTRPPDRPGAAHRAARRAGLQVAAALPVPAGAEGVPEGGGPARHGAEAALRRRQPLGGASEECEWD